jgi:hypothetical protein
MFAVTDTAISKAAMPAFNCVPLTKEVGRLNPFHCNDKPAIKFVPFTESVNPVPPTVKDGGLRLPMAGTRLLMVWLTLAEVEPAKLPSPS